jgi:hypothetical protein
MGDTINVCRISVGNPKRKRRLETCKCKWKDNIKNVLKRMWVGFLWLRTATSEYIRNFRVPQKAEIFLTR